MKEKLTLYDLLFVFVCLSTVLSDSISTSVSVSVPSILTSTISPSFAPLLPLNPQDDKNNAEQASRRAFVVNMVKENWAGYAKCAMGESGFRPALCDALFYRNPQDLWNAMPTLWIMGLQDQFISAQKWLQEKLDFSVHLNYKRDSEFDSQEFVGAMLSCYALTGDTYFLNNALKFVELYFQERTHDPPYSGDPNWRRALLGLSYVAHLTGNESIAQHTRYLDMKMDTGFEYSSFELRSSNYSRIVVTKGDYLLLRAKRYLQSNQTDQPRIDTFYRLIDDLRKSGNLNRTKSGLWYIGQEKKHKNIHFPIKLCNIGATLALAAELMPKVVYGKSSWRLLTDMDQLANVIAHWEMAKNITDTCYWGAKLTSDYMILTLSLDKSRTIHEVDYTLNPNATNINETILKYKTNKPFFYLDYCYQQLESYFTLARLTGEQRYRDYAWEMVNQIYQLTRVPDRGYINGLVGKANGALHTFAQSHLFYTNLLYIFLTFTPDTFLPLDKWVFDYYGHPLPICGSGNSAYPNVVCS